MLILLQSRRLHRLLLIWSLLFLCWSYGKPGLQAHDSPEHVVAALSQKMQDGGVTASLLHERAIEYRALGKLKAATADLVHAKKLQPDSFPVLQELSRVQQADGKYQDALQTINDALALSNAAAPAELWIVRAEIQLDLGAAREALASCQQAFVSPDPLLDWYLVRSRAQSLLGLHQARVKDLQAGLDQTGSSILKLEWIDALIEAGEFRRALAECEAEMESSRWQSTWLLRRAQSRFGLGKRAAGREDLQAVVREIGQRLNPTHPDVTLLADRGCAWALLDQPEVARQDLQSALQAGADDWVVRPLQNLLKKPSQHEN